MRALGPGGRLARPDGRRRGAFHPSLRPPLAAAELQGFLTRFARLIETDARFDLWVRSVPEGALIVRDRHDHLFAYGPLERFEAILSAEGFTPGPVTLPYRHAHRHREENDDDAAAVLARFDWTWSPLRDEDRQR